MKIIQLWLLVIIYNILIPLSLSELNDEDIKLLKKEIDKGMKTLNYVNVKKINQKQFIKLFKHLFTPDDNRDNSESSIIEDQFMFDVYRRILEGVPEEIDVDDLPKYYNPAKVEKIFNEMLGGIDLNKIMGDIRTEGANEDEKKDSSKKKIDL